MELGAFSVSLTVKDLEVSRAFYEKLGFTVTGGDPQYNYLILVNGTTVIGLFQGMFDKNILTFNPGWTGPHQMADDGFLDVREIAKRLEEANEIWLDAQHAGYKAAYGLLHRRRIFVSGAGDRLTGEDSLVRPVAQPPTDDKKGIPFEIRFHLHPTITAHMGREVIRLVSETGAVWRFKTSHEGARLERTAYLARGVVETPEQIVLSGFADPNADGSQPPNCIRWAFVREA